MGWHHAHWDLLHTYRLTGGARGDTRCRRMRSWPPVARLSIQRRNRCGLDGRVTLTRRVAQPVPRRSGATLPRSASCVSSCARMYSLTLDGRPRNARVVRDRARFRPKLK